MKETIDRYITDASKAISGYVSGRFITSDIPNCMDKVADLLGEKGGAKAIHFELLFEPAELTDPELACEIAELIATYIGQEYQVCYAVHEDTEKLHIHFIFNSLSYLDGYRYTGTTEENLRLADYVSAVLRYSAELELDNVFRAIGSSLTMNEPYQR